jgi:hypothetical protein
VGEEAAARGFYQALLDIAGKGTRDPALKGARDFAEQHTPK